MDTNDDRERGEPIRSDLPAVQPPSTSFFVQLFLLPFLIVAGIMVVWFLFGRIAGSNRTVDDYLEIIRSDRADRWKAALDLSHLLREDSTHAKNQALALTLSSELDKALSSGKNGDTQYQEYLCGALGSFQLDTGVLALSTAAKPDQTRGVRRAALIALGNLAGRLKDLRSPSLRPELEQYLQDPDAEIRSLSALDLGLLNDQGAIPSLERVLQDPEPGARFHAAIALSQLGSPKGLNVLADMLDPANLRQKFTIPNPDGGADVVDENLVVASSLNALESLRRLQRDRPATDWSPVEPALTKLADSGHGKLRSEAKEILLLLSSKAKPEKGH